MSRKTTELYVKKYQKVQQLVTEFTPMSAMADFEEASLAGFQLVYPDAGVAGCWFHCAQAVIKIVHLWSGVALPASLTMSTRTTVLGLAFSSLARPSKLHGPLSSIMHCHPASGWAALWKQRVWAARIHPTHEQMCIFEVECSLIRTYFGASRHCLLYGSNKGRGSQWSFMHFLSLFVH